MKLKKITYILIFIILIMNTVNIPVKAQDIYINARCAVALDSKTKMVLFEKDAHMLVPMASTTKIMTALVAMKYGDLDKKIEISGKAASIRGSTVGYKKGDMVTLKELLYGLMLRSGNDAAIAISEGIAGSVEGFVKLMNEYASQIGVYNTHFESPHGLDSDMHYSTAYDLAMITAKARENKLFNDIVQTRDIDANQLGFSRGFHNINKILWQLPNATGVKTGYTGDAGKCLVSSVSIQGNDVIIVVLNSNDRWNQTKKINDYVDKNYKYEKYFSKGDIVAEAPTTNNKQNVKLAVEDDMVIPVKNGKSYETKINKPTNIAAPVSKGAKLGSIDIYDEGNKIYSSCLQADNAVEKSNIIKRWFFFKR